MANFFQDLVVLDTNKRAVIKSTGILDGSGQETANVKILGQGLMGALSVDSNSAVTVAMGGTYRPNYRANVARITYNVQIPNGYVKVDLSGTTICNVATLSGAGDLNFQENMGTIGNPFSGATGNLLFSTVNASASCAYTVWIDIHKNGLDYDQGQIGSGGRQGRPNDFNFGIGSVRP